MRHATTSRLAGLSIALSILLPVPVRAAQQQPTPPAASADLTRYEGEWVGHLRRNGAEAAIRLHIAKAGQREGGTVTWTDLGYLDTPILGSSAQPGETLRVSVPLPMGTLRLTGASDGSVFAGSLEEIGRVDGKFESRGVNGGFELRRTGAIARPYVIQRLAFRSSDGTLLGGSIYLPVGKGPFPSIVYVHGSGDSSRADGAFLADMLARDGIAALVYDKRGVGDSQGQWRESTMHVLADDAHSALSAIAAHPAIDRARIGYVGRSQGGWIVPIALRKGGAAFAAFISGAAVSTVDEDLDHYRQLFAQSGHSAGDFAKAERLLRLRYAAMRGKVARDRVSRLAAAVANEPWFALLDWASLEKNETAFDRAWIAHDPTADLQAIDVPTYWLFGSADYVIPVGGSMANVISQVRKVEPRIEVIPGADHALSTGAYPDLPSGVGTAMRKIATWIGGAVAAR